LRNTNRLSFSVLSLACIACTPVFDRELRKLPGVTAVKPLVMLNSINVEIDPQKITSTELKQEVLKIADRAGLSGKIIFR
jgi:copper chaperone CopZ